MAEQERPQKRGSGYFRLFERGVDTATRNNVTAYGYSVSITAAFAILQISRTDTGSSRSSPSPPGRSWPSPSSQPWPQDSSAKS